MSFVLIRPISHTAYTHVATPGSNNGVVNRMLCGRPVKAEWTVEKIRERPTCDICRLELDRMQLLRQHEEMEASVGQAVAR